jgi:RHS repeat-associated protein
VVKVSEIDRAATGTTAAASEYFSYDGNGYLASKTDWNSNTTTSTNNSHGDPTSITEAYGSSVARTTTIAYDGTWVHEPATITTAGLTSTFTYDGSGNPLTRTDADTTGNSVPYSTNGQTRETQWTWNGTGELTSVQLPRTDVTVKTTLGYTSGVLTSITDQLSHTISITSYTGGGYPETIVDPNSVSTTLAWDARLNLNTVTVGGTYTTTYTHDPANNLTAVEKPDGSTLTYGYDAANRLTTITDLPGNTINYTLDALGDITATNVKNSGGAYEFYPSATFDALGRKLTDVGASGQTTTYTWDPNSNPLTVTDPLSNSTTYTWDALNRLATRTDPSPGGTTTLTLDAHNRATNVQDANGNSTSYVNDGFGDVTQVTSPDSGTSVYHYDKDRNLTQKVFAGGQTVNLTWDADDRNLTIAYPSDSSLNVSKTYDQSGHGYGIGRLTSVTDQPGSDSFTYDTRGNITGESRVITSVGTLSTSTSFDAASHVSSITYPSGTVVGYTRDSMGQVTGIAATPPGGSSTSVASSITYEPFGPETSLTFGNGVTGTYNFDGDYRATSREDNATAGDVTNFAYTYTATNSLYTITDNVNSVNSQTLGYDALDRMTSATSAAGGYGTYGWTWDAVSNIQTQTINSTTTTFSQNAGTNQLSQSVTGATTTTVDTTANGNILDFKIAGTAITSYTYNQANQMASATGPLSNSASYEYGFDAQRLLKTPSSGYPIVYQYGQAAKEILSENDLHSGQTADYIYMDPGRNSRPIGEVNPTSGDVYFTHTDRQGTPQAITDSGQNVVWSAFYNPFGDTSSFSGTLVNQSLRLPGQYFDPESGNNHNGFRDYAGTLTRYAQSDPIGLAGGMNTYQYVKGNPFKYTDPRGLDPKSMACQEGSVMCGSGPYMWGGGDPFLDGPDSDPDTLGPLSQITYSGGGGSGTGGQCTAGSTDPMCATGSGGNSPLQQVANGLNSTGDAQTVAQGLGVLGDVPELGIGAAIANFVAWEQNPTQQNLDNLKESLVDINPFIAVYHLGRKVFKINPAF